MFRSRVRSAFRSLKLTALLQRVDQVPPWVADAIASAIGPRVDDAIRAGRRTAVLLPSLVTLAAVVGVVLTEDFWRILLIAVAVLGLLWTLLIWFSWSATRSRAEKFFEADSGIPPQAAQRLVASVGLPEGSTERLRWAWNLRNPGEARQVLDSAAATLSELATELGLSPAQVQQLHQFVTRRPAP